MRTPKHRPPPVPLEDAEYERGAAWLTAAGFKVYRLSQKRASRQTRGVPDLYAMYPQRGLKLWWEAKRQKGSKTSPAQLEFADLCGACDHLYIRGPAAVIEQWLVANGFAYTLPNGVVVLNPRSAR